MESLRRRLPPGFRGIHRAALPGDMVAGFTVWAVLIPQALAYATIAGVPPVVGLYAAPPALVLYALLGSSRHLVLGPTAAAAVLSGAAVSRFSSNPADAIVLTAALALAVGILGLAAAALRLGFLASFISEPVLKGFIIGLSFTIMAGQAPKLLGLESVKGNFFERVWELVGSLGDAQVLTVVVGVSSLVALLLLRRFVPRVPAPLLVVLLAIAVTQIADLGAHGVAVVGDIEAGLPGVGLPDAGWAAYLGLSGSAVGILLVGFAEGLAVAKTYAAKSGDRIDPNRELLGLGAASLGAGLSSGMVVGGSLSKTAVNGDAGAHSQFSGLVTAGLTILTLLFLTDLFEDLPESVLAAIVIAAVIELVDIGALHRLFALSTSRLKAIYGPATRADLIAALGALFGVLIFDTLPGLFIGMAVSVILLTYRTSTPHVAVLGRHERDGRFRDLGRITDGEPVPGIIVVRPEAALFFINAENVRESILAAVERADEDVHSLVIDAASIPTLDITAVNMLAQLAADLQRKGIDMAIAQGVGQVHDLLRVSEVPGLMEGLHVDVEGAIAALSAAHADDREDDEHSQ